MSDARLAPRPAPIPSCRLLCSSSSQHLNQIYGGFGLLARAGRIRISATRAAVYSAGVLYSPKLEVELNGAARLVYDTWDNPRFFEAELAACDVYFKRSYAPERVAAHPHGHKIFPLGLNYVVYGPGDFWRRRALWSLLAGRRDNLRWVVAEMVRGSWLVSRLVHASNGRATCLWTNFEGVPTETGEPGVLLLTQTWDPAEVGDHPAEADDRQALNQMRADCIRKLRAEHGQRFIGGFAPSRYAIEHFPDCVVADGRQTRKHAYLQLLHQAYICVATNGLLGSTGWKVGEYVAAARPIVAERLNDRMPGNFEAGANYLEFTTPDECVAATVALRADPARRQAMMARNHAYYRAYLRPDALVWNSLQTALMRCPN